jgi:DNA-binding transcriptional MerR regulator
VKISELAEATGQSVPTLKFYIREGLIPAGFRTGRTQAAYDETHVRRVQLIELLKDELNMSIERIGEVLASAVEGGDALLRSGLSAAGQARHPRSEERENRHLGQAWQALALLKDELGWQISPEIPAACETAEALSTILRALPEDDPQEFLVPYARAMKAIAAEEIPDSFDPQAAPWESFRYAVLGTYLYEPLILALRRLAHGERASEVRAPRKGSRTTVHSQRAR